MHTTGLSYAPLDDVGKNVRNVLFFFTVTCALRAVG